MSGLRLVAVLLVLILLAPVLVSLGAPMFIDLDSWRPQIEAAVQLVTGRTVRIGRLSLVPWFSPTLRATDLTVANLPGDSRPDMLTVARAEMRLALLPLLTGRVEISRLLLVRPDILLERDAAGRANWQLGAWPATGAPPPPSAASPPGAAPDLRLRAVRIEDGRLSWRPRDAAPPVPLDLRVLEVAARGRESPVELTAQGSFAGQAFLLMGRTGLLARLLDETATTPWPVEATLAMPGARLRVAGAVTHPLARAGYALSVEGETVNLSVLAGLLDSRLPPLRQVAFAARVADAGDRLPEVTGLAVRADASDLDALVPGLNLAHAKLSAASLDEPVRAEAVGSLRGTPLVVTASFGPLAALLPNPSSRGPYPVELAAEAAGATLAVRGGIAVPAQLSGIDLAVTGRIADLSALSPLAGIHLPALHPVTLDARVADRAGTSGFAIRGLAVTTPEADVSGELMVGLGARPDLQATLSARRIDLDALLAAADMKQAAPLAAEAPLASLPAPLPKRPARLIPDGKLPFAVLDAADADVHLSIGELRSSGVAYRELSAQVSLQDGRLALDPVSGSLPGGHLEFRLTADSHVTPAPVTLTLRGSGLTIRPLLAALNLPDDIGGTADIDADLRAAGNTPRALAAGLGGRLGVAMPDGDLNNQLFGSVLGWLLPGAPPTGAQSPAVALGLDRLGRTRFHCLALHADADNGLVSIGTALLETGRVLVYGAGTLNLRDEGIALRLRPVRAAVPVVVPVRLGGTFLAPKIVAEPAGSAVTVGGLVAGLGVARGTSLGAMMAVIADERSGDTCDVALAAARAVPRPAPPKPAAMADVPRGMQPQ